ncbi:3374_t:CDS:2 [Entrophospora sp. SA101]|nr:3374_t:CDS:2 [Entrophospora sp. SA101]
MPVFDVVSTANDINNEYSLPTLEHKIKNEKELDPRLQYTAQYLRLVNSGYKKMDASNIIAQSLNRGTWCARLIRTWGKQYSKNGELIASKQGKHQKVKSIIYDEDVELKISEYLRVNKFEVTIKKFQQFVTDEILPDLGIENKISINLLPGQQIPKEACVIIHPGANNEGYWNYVLELTLGVFQETVIAVSGVCSIKLIHLPASRNLEAKAIS